MSMDKTAIEQIQHTAIAAAEVNGADHPVKALPDSMRLVSMEEFQKHRYHYKALFKTSLISAFAKYVCDEGGETCFIDKEEMAAGVIFDLGTPEHPGHAKHKAILKLEKTELYKSCLSINGKEHYQKEMAEFFEDYRDYLSFMDSEGNNMDVVKAITAIRNITIESKAKSDHQAADFRGARSAMEEVEAKANNGGGLPAKIVMSCDPYNGLGQYEIPFRLSVITSHEKPILKLRIVRLEKIVDDMAEEFEAILQEVLSEIDQTYTGTLQVK
jgi:uncharacterized protein YfdQ (DUF2303 family)